MESLLSTLSTTTAEDLFVNSSTMDFLLNPIVTTCSETSLECVIDHSLVCVGDPVFCNLTKEEYEQLLFDYISPTIPEWILIFSHIVVFLMGLVSGHSLLNIPPIKRSSLNICLGIQLRGSPSLAQSNESVKSLYCD